MPSLKCSESRSQYRSLSARENGRTGPGHERLAAEGLPVPRVQLFPDELIDRKHAR